MENWFELKVYLPLEWRDIVSSRLFELGAQGVVEDATFVSGYFPENDKVRVDAEWPPCLALLIELSPTKHQVRWEWLPVPEVNWVDKYKETFKAQKLTNNFFLQPAWDTSSPIPSEMIPIRMELGQAFGTGLHSSTRLALRLLESIVGKFGDPGNISVLDVGTGTGILAIGAEKLGVGRIHAFDIDEVSVEVAATNLRENECRVVTLSTEPIEKVTETYDIVVANILLETHKLLQGQYHRVCKKSGYLILSGFLSNQLREYRRLVDPQQWKILQECHLQDWGALLLGRK